jgi:hypothetical protein
MLASRQTNKRGNMILSCGLLISFIGLGILSIVLNLSIENDAGKYKYRQYKSENYCHYIDKKKGQNFTKNIEIELLMKGK